MINIGTKKLWIIPAGIFLLAILSVSPFSNGSTAYADNGGRPVIKVPRASGRVLFQDCVLCHKYDGRGGPSEGGYGADLRTTTLTRAQLIHVIAYGRMPKGMPAFKDLLSESKIETLADFILEDLRLEDQAAQ